MILCKGHPHPMSHTGALWAFLRTNWASSESKHPVETQGTAHKKGSFFFQRHNTLPTRKWLFQENGKSPERGPAKLQLPSWRHVIVSLLQIKSPLNTSSTVILLETKWNIFLETHSHAPETIEGAPCLSWGCPRGEQGPAPAHRSAS